MKKKIKKVAVLGAGVMGSGIAAHLANAGIPCFLLDIVPKMFTDQEKKKELSNESINDRNRLAISGIQNALKAKPAALFSKKDARLITPGNFDDHMNYLSQVNWIIEAVVENLDIKRALFRKILEYRNPGTIISSNTSGIPIVAMIEDFPIEFKQHFIVTHFFNPVRYMKLLELVKGEETLPQVVQTVAEFGEIILGKGIVYGKDTPNFIANRIGVHAMMNAIKIMLEKGMSIEEVDKIAGKPMGRPSSAAFRTADMVGLDTFLHVTKNVYESLKMDEDKEVFNAPQFLRDMVKKGILGDKTKKGFYQSIKQPDGSRLIKAIDPKTLEYHDKTEVRFDSLGAVKDIEDTGQRIKKLINYNDRAGNFCWDVVSSSLSYAANRIPEIADDIVNIDNGMKWGFNWELGPFETWDAIGVKESVERMKREGRKIPKLAIDVLEKGDGTFYRKTPGKVEYFDTVSCSYKELFKRPEILNIHTYKELNNVIKKNPSADLIDMGDDVICVEFHSKMNSIDDDIISMLNYAVELAEKGNKAIIIGNQAEHFSVGANLMLLWSAASQKDWKNIEKVVRAFQNVNQVLKYSKIPVIAAPYSMALGGGCEVCLGANAICAHAELYMGLVEVGVGLIPGGGGTKEMLIRNMDTLYEDSVPDTFPFVRRAFETIGMAKVSFSIKEAMEIGYLRRTDRIVMNRDHLLHEAKKMAKGMLVGGFVPSCPRNDLHLPGENGYAAIKAGLYAMKLGGYISEHDETIGTKLAYVLTGGKISPKEPVSEQNILDLECEAFLSLCGYEKTIARMQHMLLKNKPLRN